MKKSNINPDDVLKDANKIIELINSLDNIDLENIDDLKNQLTELESSLSKKYEDTIKESKDDLDSEE